MAKGDSLRGMGQGSIGAGSLGGPESGPRNFKPGMGMNPNPGNNDIWSVLQSLLGNYRGNGMGGGIVNGQYQANTSPVGFGRGMSPNFNMGMQSNPVRFGNPASGGPVNMPQIPRPTLPQQQPQGVPLNDTMGDSRFRNLNNGGSMMGSYRPF